MIALLVLLIGTQATYWIAESLGTPVGIVAPWLRWFLLVGAVAALVEFGLRLRDVRWGDWIFWTALTVVFFAPGIYLEYPSDPWEHLRRILAWDAVPSIAAHPSAFKFAYFFDWLAISSYPAVGRVLLNAVATAWQLGFAVSAYRLFGKLVPEYDVSWRRLLTLTFVFFYGHNLFGIRYYALSSTPLAIIAYLEAVGFVVDILFLQKRVLPRVLGIAVALCFMWGNHRQEGGLFVLSAATLGLLRWAGTDRRRWITTGAVAAVVCLGVGVYAHLTFPAYHALWKPHFLPLGFHKLFWPHSLPFETLALPGFVGAAYALWRFGESPRLFALVLAPVFVVTSPIVFALFAARNVPANLAYRVLYAMPAAVALVPLLRRYVPNPWTAGALLLTVGLLPWFPIRGRVAFALTPAAEGRRLDWLGETATWLNENRQFSRACWIYSDPITSFGLGTLLGRPLEDMRREKKTPDEVPICAVLAVDGGELPKTAPSWVARLSGHWADEDGDIRRAASAELGNTFAEKGWGSTVVPPFYVMYEPPPTLRWIMIDATTEHNQADGHLIRFPDGWTVLVDVGNNDGRVTDFLTSRNVTRLDAVLITHPHKDHYGGLEQLLQSGISIGTLYANRPPRKTCDAEKPWGCDYEHFEGMLARVERAKIPLKPVVESVMHENDGARLEILHAHDPAKSTIGDTTINDMSVVMKLSYGDTSALFTGDLDVKVGTWLAKNDKRLKADILKVPHHGAESAAPNEFLDLVDAELALVPVPLEIWDLKKCSRMRKYFRVRNRRTFISGVDGDMTIEMTKRGWTAYRGR